MNTPCPLLTTAKTNIYILNPEHKRYLQKDRTINDIFIHSYHSINNLIIKVYPKRLTSERSNDMEEVPSCITATGAYCCRKGGAEGPEEQLCVTTLSWGGSIPRSTPEYNW